jgi:hypothetical protein
VIQSHEELDVYRLAFDAAMRIFEVRKHLLTSAPRKPVTELFRVAPGGKSIEVQELCLIGGRIEGSAFDTDAVCRLK